MADANAQTWSLVDQSALDSLLARRVAFYTHHDARLEALCYEHLIGEDHFSRAPVAVIAALKANAGDFISALIPYEALEGPKEAKREEQTR